MIARLVLLLALLVAFASAQAPTVQNTQQEICAKPPKGCSSQMKLQSCINWHGCKWEMRRCKDDPSCRDGKATRVPTPSPTAPTVPTTRRPTVKQTKSPTVPPTKCADVPANGNCFSITSAAACSTYRCCFWNTAAARCQYREPPTAAPTTASPTTPPVAPNCFALRGNKMACRATEGCRWCARCKPALRCRAT